MSQLFNPDVSQRNATGKLDKSSAWCYHPLYRTTNMNDLKKFKIKVMITGGAGFIGSNLLLHMVKKYPEYLFVNLDKLTYAANLANLHEIEMAENYIFAKGDICDRGLVSELFQIRAICVG